MKRNLVLLTAVVLAAVLLSGCALWPFGQLKVSYVLDETIAADFVKEHKNPAKVKKEAKFDVKFEYAEGKAPDYVENAVPKYGVELSDKDAILVPESLVYMTKTADDETVTVTGIEFKVQAGKKDFKVTLVPVEAAE